MKCANCGNTNRNSLFDEEDTIYCSKCTHRTNKSTNKDDTVICPVCHKPRDRKALYCRWCNDSTWGKNSSTKNKKKRYNNYDYETDYIDESTDSAAENLGTSIGIIIATGLFLYGIGKGIYKSRKEKRLKEPSKKEKRKKKLKISL